MAQSIPSVTFRAFVILSVPAVGICQNTSAGGGAFVKFLLKWLTLFLFQYFIKKYAYYDSFRYLCKEYFYTYAFKR